MTETTKRTPARATLCTRAFSKVEHLKDKINHAAEVKSAMLARYDGKLMELRTKLDEAEKALAAFLPIEEQIAKEAPPQD